MVFCKLFDYTAPKASNRKNAAAIKDNFINGVGAILFQNFF